MYENLIKQIDWIIDGSPCVGCQVPQRWKSVVNLLNECKYALQKEDENVTE